MFCGGWRLQLGIPRKIKRKPSKSGSWNNMPIKIIKLGFHRSCSHMEFVLLIWICWCFLDYEPEGPRLTRSLQCCFVHLAIKHHCNDASICPPTWQCISHFTRSMFGEVLNLSWTPKINRVHNYSNMHTFYTHPRLFLTWNHFGFVWKWGILWYNYTPKLQFS